MDAYKAQLTNSDETELIYPESSTDSIYHFAEDGHVTRLDNELNKIKSDIIEENENLTTKGDCVLLTRQVSTNTSMNTLTVEDLNKYKMIYAKYGREDSVWVSEVMPMSLFKGITRPDGWRVSKRNANTEYGAYVRYVSDTQVTIQTITSDSSDIYLWLYGIK